MTTIEFSEVDAVLQLIAGWPRRAKDASGLGTDVAKTAFSETAAGIADELENREPSVFAPMRDDDWSSFSIYELIEAHSSYFRLHRAQRGSSAARPYDEMGVAFPALSQIVAPLLLGRAILAERAQLHALEPVILVRKQNTSTKPRPHAHTGRKNCGVMLNTLVLVAHCTVGSEVRCLVLGNRPLSRYQELDLSAPIAIRELLASVDQAATAFAGTRAEVALLDAPVVAGLLQGGGPRGRKDPTAVTAELVAARSSRILSAIRSRGSLTPGRAPRALALRLPTDPPIDNGAHRLAPNGLEPVDAHWSPDPVGFAATIASAPPEAAVSLIRDGVEWVTVPARLTQLGDPIPVTLLGRRRVGSNARGTVWLVDGRSQGAAQIAINASRQSHESTPGGDLTARPWDSWVMRAYRRHAAGDLIIKGGAGENLLAGAGAALNAGFASFALRA